MKLQKSTAAMLPIALAVSAAWATDSGEFTTLDTSVVSATGYEQDVREAPASVSVITTKEIQTKPVKDIGSAIGDVPGVDIGLSKMGNSTVSIRGFDSTYTLMMIDGKRQNASSAMMNNGFDPTSTFMPPVGFIDRIEVLRGPASVAWGTDAVGGVVNIITKRHPKAFTGSVTLEGTLQEHDEYGNMGAGSFYMGIPLKEDTLSLILRGGYRKTGEQDIRTPTGDYASHTSAETYSTNLGGRLTLTVDEANSFYVDADYTRFKGGSMLTSSQKYQAHRWYDKSQLVVAHDGNYKWGTTESYLQFNSLDLMKVQTKANPGLTPTSGTRPFTPTNVDGSFSNPLMSSRTYTAATKFITPMELDNGQALKVTGGVEANYETFEDNYYETVLSGQKLDQTLLAVFLEGEYFLNDQWSATVGARLNWSDIFGSNLAPRAYLVYRPFDFISFKGGVAAGYKTPNVKQLMNGIYSGTEPGGRTWDNPNLDPEESWSYELSTTIDFGKAAQLTIGGFYTDFKNMIGTENDPSHEYTQGSQIVYDQHVVNYGKVRTQGLEVFLKTNRFYGFSFTGGYTFTDAEVRNGEKAGQRPNELPRHTLTARVDYENGPFSAYLKSASKFDMKVQKTGRGDLPRDKYNDYTIVDLGGSYEIMKGHRISAAINNLFDKSTNEWVANAWDRNGVATSYANAYSHYLDGRNLWLSYTYSW